MTCQAYGSTRANPSPRDHEHACAPRCAQLSPDAEHPAPSWANRPRVAVRAPTLPRMRAIRAWLACLALLLMVPVAGCQDDTATQEQSAPVTLHRRPAPPPGADESMREAALALVDAREEALRNGDRDAFLATVDPDDLGFSSTQARWFDNLALLPVVDVSIELGDEGVLADVDREGGLQLPIELTMRLEG